MGRGGCQSQWAGICKDVGAWPSSVAKGAGAATIKSGLKGWYALQVEDVPVALHAREPRACSLHRRRVVGHERSHLVGADLVDQLLEALCDQAKL